MGLTSHNAVCNDTAKVETLTTKLDKEKRKSAAYKDKLLDVHRKNMEAKMASMIVPACRWNN